MFYCNTSTSLVASCLLRPFCSSDLSLFAKIAFAFERVWTFWISHQIEDTLLYRMNREIGEKISLISVKLLKSWQICPNSHLVRRSLPYFSLAFTREADEQWWWFDREKSSLSDAMKNGFPVNEILWKYRRFFWEGLNKRRLNRATERVLCAVRVVREKEGEEKRQRRRRRRTYTITTTTTTTIILIHSIEHRSLSRARPRVHKHTNAHTDNFSSLSIHFISLIKQIFNQSQQWRIWQVLQHHHRPIHRTADRLPAHRKQAKARRQRSLLVVQQQTKPRKPNRLAAIPNIRPWLNKP